MYIIKMHRVTPSPSLLVSLHFWAFTVFVAHLFPKHLRLSTIVDHIHALAVYCFGPKFEVSRTFSAQKCAAIVRRSHVGFNTGDNVHYQCTLHSRCTLNCSFTFKKRLRLHFTLHEHSLAHCPYTVCSVSILTGASCNVCLCTWQRKCVLPSQCVTLS